MVKLLLEFVLGALILMTLITQVIAPLFVKNLQMFWLFRKDEPKAPPVATLQDLDDKVDDTVRRYEEVEDEVEETSEAMSRITEKLKKKSTQS